jgi:hypothetical protein
VQRISIAGHFGERNDVLHPGAPGSFGRGANLRATLYDPNPSANVFGCCHG